MDDYYYYDLTPIEDETVIDEVVGVLEAQITEFVDLVDEGYSNEEDPNALITLVGNLEERMSKDPQLAAEVGAVANIVREVEYTRHL